MKRIVVSILLSFMGPGLGQIYNKELKKGILLLAISSILFFLPLVWILTQIQSALPNIKTGTVPPEMVQSVAMDIITRDKHLFNLISFTFLGLWAYAITQAYFKAKEFGTKTEEGK